MIFSPYPLRSPRFPERRLTSHARALLFAASNATIGKEL